MSTHPVLLASQSPQRKAILDELDIVYDAVPMDATEVTLSDPAATVVENSYRKLLKALNIATDGQAIITADTLVWANGQILGKPHTSENAKNYLNMLSGNTVSVYSGLAVAVKGSSQANLCADIATMTMRRLSEAEIDWYIATREPLTRAGAIGISHYGEAFITRIDGSYSCIAGLSKPALLAILASTPSLSDAILPVPPPPPSLAHSFNLLTRSIAPCNQS